MGAYQNFGEVVIEFDNDISAAPVVHSPSKHKSYYQHESIEASIDGNPKTKWCVEHKVKPVIWQVELPEDQAVALSSYSFTSGSDAPGRDPKNWTLYGSNNQRAWNKLDHRSDEPKFETRGQKKTYTFNNTEKYRYYSIVILPNTGFPRIQLAEINLDGISFDKTKTDAYTKYRRSVDLATGNSKII